MRQKYTVSLYFKKLSQDGTFIDLRIRRHKFVFQWTAIIFSLIMKLVVETRVTYIPLYSIDTDAGVSYRDSGRWRSYQFETAGDCLCELVQNGTVSEIDQDGGELNTYSLIEAPSEVEAACLEIIQGEISK